MWHSLKANAGKNGKILQSQDYPERRELHLCLGVCAFMQAGHCIFLFSENYLMQFQNKDIKGPDQIYLGFIFM